MTIKTNNETNNETNNKAKSTSWLFSDNFLKRSISIFGHCFVGYICTVVPIAIIFGIIVGLFVS